MRSERNNVAVVVGDAQTIVWKHGQSNVAAVVGDVGMTTSRHEQSNAAAVVGSGRLMRLGHEPPAFCRNVIGKSRSLST